MRMAAITAAIVSIRKQAPGGARCHKTCHAMASCKSMANWHAPAVKASGVDSGEPHHPNARAPHGDMCLQRMMTAMPRKVVPHLLLTDVAAYRPSAGCNSGLAAQNVAGTSLRPQQLGILRPELVANDVVMQHGALVPLPEDWCAILQRLCCHRRSLPYDNRALQSMRLVS